MATSETRKGPGWWMALDGGWNPPELWPESTPPLPGWVRGVNGRWSAPTEPAPVVDAGTLDLTMGSVATPPTIDLRKVDANESSVSNAPAMPNAIGGAHVDGVDHRRPLGSTSQQRPSFEFVQSEIAPGELVDQASVSNRRRIILSAIACVIALGIAGLVIALLLL